MPRTAKPRLRPGRVYRTKDLARWGKNPSRLARRLVKEGVLEKLAHGLFFHPDTSRFGDVPADDHELMRGFLEDSAFVFTGPEQWNALGLGSTAVFAGRLVYNTKRSGEFQFGRRTFLLRRVPFPRNPAPEWFAIDLSRNRDKAGVSLRTLEDALVESVKANRLRLNELRRAAIKYGTRETQALVDRVEGAALAR